MSRQESPELQAEALKAELNQIVTKAEKIISDENFLDHQHKTDLEKLISDSEEETDLKKSIPGLQGFVDRGRELMRLSEIKGEEAEIIKQAREEMAELGRLVSAAEFEQNEGEDVGDHVNDYSTQERQLEYALDEWRQGGHKALERIKDILEKVK